MSEDRAYLRSVFLMEAWDTLESLQPMVPALRRLEGGCAEELDGWAIASHRLKGAAGLHELPRVAALAARLERLVGGAQAGEADDTRADAVDDYLGLLARLLDKVTATGVDTDDGAISELAEQHGFLEAPPRQVDPRVTTMISQLAGFRRANSEVLEYFLPETSDHLDVIDDALLALERQGHAAHEIDRLFRAVHTLKGAAYVVSCDPIGDLAHELEDRLVEIREGREAMTPDMLQALFFGAGGLRALSAWLGGKEVELETRLIRALSGLRGAGPVPSAEPIPAQPVEAPTAVVPPGEPVTSTAAPVEAPVPTVRVRIDRLERLMNSVGELVLTRARLERRLERLESLGQDLNFARGRMTDAVREFEQRHAFTRMGGDGEAREADGARLPAADLATIFSELEFDRYDDFNLFARRATEISGDLSEVQQQVLLSIRGLVEESAALQQLTRSLRGEITRARLLPLTPLFIRLERQARESGMALDKAVDLITEGGQVELDSRVVNELADGLLHLVTNALTHGLETEAERVALGKPPRGTIWIRAEQQGARILLEVEDDGRGIDLAAVRRTAVERGMLSPAQAETLTEPEAIGLLFRPGFSTAQTVSTTAGRGVGLDAVRTKLRSLRGEIRVATVAGQGTKFRIALPLTVAITDALMLKVGGQTFGLPLTVVREIRQIASSDFTHEGEARYRSPEGDLQPAFRLENLLGVEGAATSAQRPLVVVAAGDRSYGLAVDELVGKEEAVFKTLGRFLEGAGPYGGAMLTGAGEIVLILDPAMLWSFRDNVGVTSPAASSVPSPGALTTRPRILLVDDSISVRRVVSGMLERGGFEVTTATDGVEALERLGDQPVDLVLTDLEMPRLNGFELLQDIRRRSATRAVPVVVLTSRSTAKHENLARQLGASRFLAKPVQEDTLLATVQDAIGAVPAGSWGGPHG